MFKRRQKNKSIAELKEIVQPLAYKYGVDSIYLFGSRARGDYTADSDYDFLVYTGNAKPLDIGNLYYDLCDELGTDVDFVLGRVANKAFLDSIRPDMRLLYG